MCPDARIVISTVVLVVATTWLPTNAQPQPPSINTVNVNGGSDVTSDRLAVTITYTHPAAPGTPIPWYRIRTWPATRQAPNWGPYQANAARSNVFSVQLIRAEMINPIPGNHTIEIQIKDGFNRESPPRAVIVNRRVTAVTVAPAQHRVQDEEVATLFGFARSEGYLSHAEPLNPHSRCGMAAGYTTDGTWSMLVQAPHIMAPGIVVKPRCRFRFFTGKLLQPGWRLLGVDIRNVPPGDAGWVFEQPIKPSGRDASFSVVAEMKITYTLLAIRSIAFEGPPGANWRQAFKQ